MMSAEDAVKDSWMCGNGIFDPTAFMERQKTLQGGDDGEAMSTVDNCSSIQESLRRYWRLATLQALGSSSSLEQSKLELLLETWFDRLVRMHNEDTRHYHTTVHLWEMIQYLDLLQLAKSTDKLVKPDDGQADVDSVVLLLSIFFHDAVYDGKSASNEEDSARLFERFAEELSIPLPIRTAVVDYIIATKMHQITQDSDGSSASLSSLALFLDLDMAVLGKEPLAYNKYAALIRREYSFVPHDDYCHKRADVLESFLLQQPRIYATPIMYQALEQQARTNLRNEIDSLRRGVIPGTTLDELAL